MAWEFKILDFIQTLHTPFLDKLMVGASSLGNGGLIWIALVLILLAIPKTRPAGKVLVLALVLEIVVTNLVIKPLVARARPYTFNPSVELLVKECVDYSFPSGHTAMAFTVTTGLFVTRMKRLGLASLILAVTIAFSRLYLYVHFPTDVLGGILIGIVSAWIGYMVFQQIYIKKFNHKLDMDNTDKTDRSLSDDQSR